MSIVNLNDLKIKDSEFNAVKQAALARNPNAPSAYGQGGMTDAQLKNRLDAGLLLMKTRYNEFIDMINGTSGGVLTAVSLAAFIGTGIATAPTLRDIFIDLLDGTFGNYAKVINNGAAVTLSTAISGCQIITGTTDPTTSTAGALHQCYYNTSSKSMFLCTAVSGGSYTWMSVNDKGENGDAGYTPVRGIDYWTTADQQSIVQQILEALPTYTGGTV